MNEAPVISPYTALSYAMRLPPMVGRLVEFFGARDIEAYIVGGAIRDALMCREAEDVDVAVDADAYPVATEIAEALNGSCARLHDEWQVARVAIPEEGRLFSSTSRLSRAT